MFSRSRSNRQRNNKRNQASSYESLEARNLLAVTSVFSGGELTISFDEAVVITTVGDNVTVNGELVDGNLREEGVQAVTVGSVSDLTFVGAAEFNDLAVNLDGAFDDGSLQSITLTNINTIGLDGIYVTDQLTGDLVGNDGLFSGAGQIVVNGTTLLQSADAYDISLQNVNNDFVGSVNVSTSGVVSLTDANDIVLGDVDVRSLTLEATGMISDVMNSTISVPSATILTADSIDLGNNGNAVDLFAVISNTAGAFQLNELNQFVWSNSSTVGSADINAGGRVVIGPSANIEVLGDAVLSASSLRLGVGGSNSFNTGRINVNTTSNAFIWENSGVELFGDNSVADLDVIATGNITNADNAVISVEGISSFQSVTSISIGNSTGDTFNTGFLEFFSNNVNVSEDSSTVIAGLANFAGNLTIDSNGTITDTADAFIFIQNNGTFISAVDEMMEDAGVVLGDGLDDFFVAGSVSFDVTDGNFVLRENNGTVVASIDGFVNTANAINIFSADDLVNGESAIVNVATTATLAGDRINFGQALNDNIQFGSVNVNTGGNATIEENDGVLLTGSAFVGGDLVAFGTAGLVEDSDSSLLTVAGRASFFASDGINIGDLPAPIDGGPGDIFRAGTLRFSSSGDVAIVENGDMILAGIAIHQSGGQVTLTAVTTLEEAGTISNDAGADVTVMGNLFVTAGGDIDLGSDGTDVINFGNLNFSSTGMVDIVAIFDDPEDGFFIFGTDSNPNTAGELRLTTNVDVQDGTNAVIDIETFIRIEARNITLGDTATDCLMIPDAPNQQFVTTDAAPNVTTDAACP